LRLSTQLSDDFGHVECPFVAPLQRSLNSSLMSNFLLLQVQSWQQHPQSLLMKTRNEE
jgi:hypothetical protein